MTTKTYAEICTPELLAGAVENNEYHGFKQDYHVLWCLLKMYQPKSVFEIGTNMGTGTNIICHAVPNAIVHSLDLPTEQAHISLQHPISEGKGDNVGIRCKMPYIQHRCDSMLFDYSQHPCDAYFIDGEHDFEHPHHEGKQVFKCKPKLVIWHDADIHAVSHAIIAATPKNYTLIRVADTRIAYAVR